MLCVSFTLLWFVRVMYCRQRVSAQLRHAKLLLLLLLLLNSLSSDRPTMRSSLSYWQSRIICFFFLHILSFFSSLLCLRIFLYLSFTYFALPPFSLVPHFLPSCHPCFLLHFLLFYHWCFSSVPSASLCIRRLNQIKMNFLILVSASVQTSRRSSVSIRLITRLRAEK